MAKVLSLHSSKEKVESPSHLKKNESLTGEVQAPILFERRLQGRTILPELICLHLAVPFIGSMKVPVYDITLRGLSFELDPARGSVSVGDKLELRIALGRNSYVPFQVFVRHVTSIQEEEVFRVGCEYDADSINNQAIKEYILFLQNITPTLKRDQGDKLIK
jgi:hypothetical protein